MEPHKLRRWKISISPNDEAYLYTCARPGRSKGPNGAVPDEIVSSWINGLPSPNTAIVLLLGRKNGSKGDSEFKFYSFCGGFDTISERGSSPTFQEWLDKHHQDLQILVCEHPTYDFKRIHSEALDTIKADVLQLLSKSRTVVIVDSGGETRTGQVCKYLKATEDFQNR